MWKQIILGIIVLFVGIQFFGKSPGNPEFDKQTDLIEQLNPNQEIQGILKNACYDCHSNETKYPWYAKVAPIKWSINKHIRHGREELNFSIWGTYELGRKDHKLEEVVEVLEEGEMPLTSYISMHSEAQLSKEQVNALISWAKTARGNLK